MVITPNGIRCSGRFVEGCGLPQFGSRVIKSSFPANLAHGRTLPEAGSRGTSVDNSAAISTSTYDVNGNLTNVVELTTNTRTTMVYDKENRLSVHSRKDNTSILTKIATYMYDGDGLKRVEVVKDSASAAATTTLMWDGSDYLGSKS